MLSNKMAFVGVRGKIVNTDNQQMNQMGKTYGFYRVRLCYFKRSEVRWLSKTLYLKESPLSICLSMSNIDWSVTKDVFTIVGTISAIVLGIIGLTTWRRQLKGTSEYELAKKTILLTYEIE